MRKINKLGIAAVFMASFFSTIAFAGDMDYVKFVTTKVPENAPYNEAEVTISGYAGEAEAWRCGGYSIFNKSPDEKYVCPWRDSPTPIPNKFLINIRYGYSLPNWAYTVENPNHKKPCKIHITFDSTLPPVVSPCQN